MNKSFYRLHFECDYIFFFRSLRTFFDSLADDLGDMKVGRDFFIALLYEKMSSDLMSMLLQDCITKAIPIGPNDEARFEQLKSLMKEFLHRLQVFCFIF